MCKLYVSIATRDEAQWVTHKLLMYLQSFSLNSLAVMYLFSFLRSILTCSKPCTISVTHRTNVSEPNSQRLHSVYRKMLLSWRYMLRSPLSQSIYFCLCTARRRPLFLGIIETKMGVGMFYTYIPRFLRAFGAWLIERKSFFTSFLLFYKNFFPRSAWLWGLTHRGETWRLRDLCESVADVMCFLTH